MTIRGEFSVAAIAVGLIATGCSTYKGERIGTITEGGKDRVVNPTGVPYNLPTYEFLLTRAPAATPDGKATLTLSVGSKPDPNQNFSVRLAPSEFANPDFKIYLNTGGSLKSTTATSTEQITPTIKAIGSFAANIIGAIATGALNKSDWRQPILDALGGATGACVRNWDFAPRSPLDPAAKTTSGALAARINTYKDEDDFKGSFHYATALERDCLVTAAVKVRYNAPKSSYANYRDGYKGDDGYVRGVEALVSKRDRNGLVALRTENNKILPTNKDLATKREELLAAALEDVRVTAYETARDDYAGDPDFRDKVDQATSAMNLSALTALSAENQAQTSTSMMLIQKRADLLRQAVLYVQRSPYLVAFDNYSGDDDFQAKVDKAVSSNDPSQLKGLTEENRATLAKDKTALANDNNTLMRDQKAPGSDKTRLDNDQAAIAKDQVTLANDTALIAKRDALLALATTFLDDVVTPFDPFIAMTPEAWQARHLAFLDKLLADLDLYLLQHPGPLSGAVTAVQITTYRNDLNRAEAATIDAELLYDRKLSLQTFLANVPSKTTKDGTAPAAAEYAQLRLELDEIDKRIAALRTSTVAAAKPKADPNSGVKALQDEPVPAIFASELESQTPTANSPRYLVVLGEPQ